MVQVSLSSIFPTLVFKDYKWSLECAVDRVANMHFIHESDAFILPITIFELRMYPYRKWRTNRLRLNARVPQLPISEYST